jgi:hypothetical protein
MPTLQEWLNGVTSAGETLDPIKVARYRARVQQQDQQQMSLPEEVLKSAPALVIRGWNFAKAIARWTLAGLPRRSQAEIEERLAICQACPHLQNDHCQKCGCACVEQNRLMNKLALATERCPLGKW